ncbi:hypothetical protein [Bacillus phage phiAGATE]|uniref:Uncharacterized protein n=1 Tax=Bacillus phage phiAGATE TaxID=1204533 RepID=L0L8C4_9CAUD|nr:hypothetical protein G380_gp179 [Bacillus phage phiAGATE]AGB62644.1 hypothetical protein [Bacillus phage phiAGATE]
MEKRKLPNNKFNNLSEKAWEESNEVTKETREGDPSSKSLSDLLGEVGFPNIRSNNEPRIITPEETKHLSGVDYEPMYRKAMEYVNQLLLVHFADRANQGQMEFYLNHDEYSVQVINHVIEEIKTAGWSVRSADISPSNRWVTRIELFIPREYCNLTEKQEKELDMIEGWQKAIIAYRGRRRQEKEEERDEE